MVGGPIVLARYWRPWDRSCPKLKRGLCSLLNAVLAGKLFLLPSRLPEER